MQKNNTGNLGLVVCTMLIAKDMKDDPEFAKDIEKAFSRYRNCDWGELGKSDKTANNEAIANPGSDRILARYATCKGDIYIITEADKSATTILFCDEY
jgi:hypothetical protein